MGFRLLVIGGRGRVEYTALCAALDALLANRLPDVEILTAGGPGVPALAACYAADRVLVFVALPSNGSATPRRTGKSTGPRLAAGADGAVRVGQPVTTGAG